MESMFAKYMEPSAPKEPNNKIASINSLIDSLYNQGRKIIEAEIQDLSQRIEHGQNLPIFRIKVKRLVAFGLEIEDLYEAYHFNKDN